MIFEENLGSQEYNPILEWSLSEDNSLVITGKFQYDVLGEFPQRNNLQDYWLFIAKVNLDIEIQEDTEVQSEEPLIFPNPTTGLLYLKLENEFFGERPLRIYDSIGRQVKTLPTLGDRTQFYIDISELPAGIYFLQVGEGDANVHKIYKR